MFALSARLRACLCLTILWTSHTLVDGHVRPVPSLRSTRAMLQCGGSCTQRTKLRRRIKQPNHLYALVVTCIKSSSALWSGLFCMCSFDRIATKDEATSTFTFSLSWRGEGSRHTSSGASISVPMVGSLPTSLARSRATLYRCLHVTLLVRSSSFIGFVSTRSFTIYLRRVLLALSTCAMF